MRLPPYRVDLLHVPKSAQDGVDWGVSSYGIPELWKKTQGEGVTVAVVDSGIAPHPALTNVVDRRNFSSDTEAYDTLGHGCIAPDDEVYTSACGVQKIQTLFDRVDGVAYLMRDGSVIKDVSRLGIYTLGYDPETQQTVRRKIEAVHKLPYSGKIIRVSTREGDLRFTPWHPVYAQTSARGGDRTVKKLRADELQLHHRLVASRESDGVYSDVHHIHLTPRWVCRFCEYEATAGSRTQCRKCSRHRWHSGPANRSIALDESLAFFLGLVASDGHVMKHSKTVAFYNNSRALADVFESLCVSLFGKKPTEEKRDARSASIIQQRLHSSDAWELCAKHMGFQSNKSLTMEFPELIAKSRPSVVMSFIAGVVEGDGSVCKKTGRVRVTTGSEKFAKRLVAVCRFLGICASSHIVPPSKTGFKTTRNSWHVRIGRSQRLEEMLRVKKIHESSPVKDRRAVGITAITTEQYEGCMYDLTVEGSHNYAANGVIVSNTHVAGIIGAVTGAAKGIAPKVKLLSLKVLGHSGVGSNDAVATAVRFAADAGVDLICMSLGSPSPSDHLHQAIQYANGKGVVIVCAAGNDGGSVNFPAAFTETIAVGAVDKHGHACEFSSKGREIVVAAPGQDITSTWLGGGYATISGTSMAAPFVAGVLALSISANGKCDLRCATEALARTCRDVGVPGRDDQYGWGLLDPHKLIGHGVQAVQTQDGITIWIPGAKIL